jgi:glycosyltransferase involved in cell wall biosynthesis
MKNIYFIVPYPHGEAPSQRFRYEQYRSILSEHGYDYHISAFIDMEAWGILYKPGNLVRKSIKILGGWLRRIGDIYSMSGYDFVFIHREAAPIGPPILEWIIAKILKKKIIYDFDDAIWLPNTSSENKIAAGIKYHSKVKNICRWAYKVSCGNEYLADYAREYNQSVIVNPTTIDTLHLHNRIKDQTAGGLVIGWTGTHSTIKYLDDIVPILQELESSHNFIFAVISNTPPAFVLKSLQYIKWSKETEIDDLLRFNIGIMPLTDDQWARGKCGFKALQYMSLGIPALVSPVGVNLSIVDNGINGMICSTAGEWKENMEMLMKDNKRIISLGIEARMKVERKYSVNSNTLNFLSLFAD